ncbi:MAG: ABC transporter ATP-binding protein [Opitutales bacterium]
MIEIRNLTKSYRTGHGRHYVFRDVNAVFPEGKSVGIIGRNGAGKTTLLNILGGIDYPDSGEVKTEKKISWPMGMSGNFVRHISGRENCKFICRIYGDSPAVIREKLKYIEELSGIGKFFDEPLYTYSAGMKARVSFALSMAFEFDIYLMDEVGAPGDRIFKQITSRALEERKSKSTAIMVSHSLTTLRASCDIGVLIGGGRVRIFEDIEEAIHTYENE